MNKIRVTSCRKEYDTIVYTLTPENYKKFLELKKLGVSTDSIGEWIIAHSIPDKQKYYDSFGVYAGINTLYDETTKEEMQD